MITHDPATWPTGDRIWSICQAIAFAEGADKQGSNPDRLNNPGDLSDGCDTFGYEEHSGSKVTKFPDKKTGWQWLYNKIYRHISALSGTYPADLTITEFAKKYAANWENWKKNVGKHLGVDADKTSFREYININKESHA